VRWLLPLVGIGITVLATLSQACSGSASVLSQEVAARRLIAELRVQFSKASDASNRSVMADTDEASIAAANEANDAIRTADQTAQTLAGVLHGLGRADEVGLMDSFRKKFGEYKTLDAEILGLAVENTNLKAQHLSFGPGAEAADAFRKSLDEAAQAAASKEIEALAARAALSVRDIQVLQARHIAEADEAAMTRMEHDMADKEAAARKDLAAIAARAPSASKPSIAAAGAALDRFKAVHTEILSLSRRNSNVRSLALSLGQKRMVTAECDEFLLALQDSIAKHEFRATR